jgi:hypothetical protein
MDKRDYHCEFTVEQTPQEVYDAIGRVPNWWGKDVEGPTMGKGDVFMIHFGSTNVKWKITEAKPGERIVWHVVDCTLDWLNDKKEWKGSDLVFDITTNTKGTHLRMTHKGLVPGIECYDQCEQGWNFHAGVSLRELITTGKGQPVAKSKRA